MKDKVYVTRAYDADGKCWHLSIEKPDPRSYSSKAIMSIDPTATYVGGPNGIKTIDKCSNQEIVDLLLFNHNYEVMTDAQVRARYR